MFPRSTEGFTDGDEWAGYLDTASGMPPTPAIRQAWSAALAGGWPDPGRRYPSARAARALLDQSRVAVGRVLGVPAASVLFPESPEHAVWSALTAHRFEGRRVLVSAVEEPDVWRAADAWAAAGGSVHRLGVDRTGRVDVGDVAAQASDAPAVVVVQAASLEIGTRQPLAELRAVLPARTPLVVDARAVLGREPPPVEWDILVGDPRMWGAPSSGALLAMRDPARFRPDTPVTEGALGLEPARPAVAAIAAAALGLEQAQSDEWRGVAGLVDRLRDRVTTHVPDTQVLGHSVHRVAYLVMFSFLYVPADELVDELARRGWAVASGASCTSDTLRPHHVLVAIGALTHGSLRVSLGPWATAERLDAFASDLVEVVARIRRETGVTDL